MHLPLHHHLDAVNAFQKLEDPPQGWPRSRLVDLMWYRFMPIGSLLTQSALRQRIHQHSQRHYHQ
jgi:hypothetical protein